MRSIVEIFPGFWVLDQLELAAIALLKITDLLDLVATSDFFSSQQKIYKRALFQVENLLDKAEELQ